MRILSQFLLVAVLIGTALATGTPNSNGGSGDETSSMGPGTPTSENGDKSGDEEQSNGEKSSSFSGIQNKLLEKLMAVGLVKPMPGMQGYDDKDKEQNKWEEELKGYPVLEKKLKCYPIANIFLHATKTIKEFISYYEISDKATQLEKLNYMRQISGKEDRHLMDVFCSLMRQDSHNSLIRVDDSPIAGKGLFPTQEITGGQPKPLGFFELNRTQAVEFLGEKEKFDAAIKEKCGLSDADLLQIDTHAISLDGRLVYGITYEDESEKQPVGVQMCNDGNFNRFIEGIHGISEWLDRFDGEIDEVKQAVETAMGILWVYRWCNGILKCHDQFNHKYGFYALMSGEETIEAKEEICYSYIRLHEANGKLANDIIGWTLKDLGVHEREWEITTEDRTKGFYNQKLVFKHPKLGERKFKVSLREALENHASEYLVNADKTQKKEFELPECLHVSEKYTKPCELKKAMDNGIKVYGEKDHDSGLGHFIHRKRAASIRELRKRAAMRISTNEVFEVLRKRNDTMSDEEKKHYLMGWYNRSFTTKYKRLNYAENAEKAMTAINSTLSTVQTKKTQLTIIHENETPREESTDDSPFDWSQHETHKQKVVALLHGCANLVAQDCVDQESN